MKRLCLISLVIVLLVVLVGGTCDKKGENTDFEEAKEKVLGEIETAKDRGEIEEDFYNDLITGVTAAIKPSALLTYLNSVKTKVAIFPGLCLGILSAVVTIAAEGPTLLITTIKGWIYWQRNFAMDKGDFAKADRCSELINEYCDLLAKAEDEGHQFASGQLKKNEPISSSVSLPAEITFTIAEAYPIEIDLPIIFGGGVVTTLFIPGGTIAVILEPTDDPDIASLLVTAIDVKIASFEIPGIGETEENLITVNPNLPFTGFLNLANGVLCLDGLLYVTNALFPFDETTPIVFTGSVAGILQNDTIHMGGFGITSYPSVLPTPDKITIGAARSRSGPQASIGDYAFGPVLDYWMDEVNAAGGINVAGKYLPVELHIQDDNSQMSVMTSLLTTMVTSGDYDFVFSPVSTAFLQAAAMICNANEYILLGAEGGCTSIMDDLVNLPYVFGVLNFADHNQMEELFRLLDEWWETCHDPDTMDIYVIYIDDLDGLEYRDEFASEAANYPGQFNIVMEVAVAPFAVDVSAELAVAEALNVDVVCAFTYPPTTMAVIDQANALGINLDALVLGWGANFQYFYDTFGPSTEGVIGLGAWNEDTSAAAAAFAADMIARHGRVYMDWWGQLYYYAGLQCFQQAIERAGTLDQSVIRDILATEHFTTVLGDTWFEDANGNHPIAAGGGLLAVECHPGQIGQWQSGIFEVIDLGLNNTAAGIYPKPDWP